MAGVIEWYNDVMDNRGDPRVSNWFLMSGLGPVITIVATYVYLSVSAGPWYMKDKKPYSLRKTLIVYNFIQVLLSIYLVYESLTSGWLKRYNFRCQPPDYSDNPDELRMVRITHVYFLAKLTELLDTLFFVLRKKDRQITFLHVYHHALMPVATWLFTKFAPGGHITLMGMINSLVHVIMYAYYMLAALGPEVQKYLWWKKYLTIFQLVQFVIIFVHNAQALVTDCAVSKPLTLIPTINGIVFLYLFGSFYVQTYTKKSSENKRKKKEEGSSDARRKLN